MFRYSSPKQLFSQGLLLCKESILSHNLSWLLNNLESNMNKTKLFCNTAMINKGNRSIYKKF